ncbi:hypothetical protein ACTFIY_010513 [Dictyostelium cf. discoideum]
MENHFNNNNNNNKNNKNNDNDNIKIISINEFLNNNSNRAPLSVILGNRRIFVLQSYKEIISLRRQPFNEKNHYNQINILDNKILQIVKEVGEYTKNEKPSKFDKVESILFIDDCLLQIKMLNQFCDILKEDFSRFPIDANPQSKIPTLVLPTPPLLFEIDNEFDPTPSTDSSPSSVSYSPNLQSNNNNNNNKNNNNPNNKNK